MHKIKLVPLPLFASVNNRCHFYPINMQQPSPLFSLLIPLSQGQASDWLVWTNVDENDPNINLKWPWISQKGSIVPWGSAEHKWKTQPITPASQRTMASTNLEPKKLWLPQTMKLYMEKSLPHHYPIRGKKHLLISWGELEGWPSCVRSLTFSILGPSDTMNPFSEPFSFMYMFLEFEPKTSLMLGKCSNHLSYAQLFVFVFYFWDGGGGSLFPWLDLQLSNPPPSSTGSQAYFHQSWLHRMFLYAQNKMHRLNREISYNDN